MANLRQFKHFNIYKLYFQETMELIYKNISIINKNLKIHNTIYLHNNQV